MDNKIKDPFEFADLVDQELFKTINNITLILVLFYADDQSILKEEEYELAVCAAMDLLRRSREDLTDLKDLSDQFQSNIREEKKGLSRRI